MKVTISMLDSAEKKTNKSFDKIPETVSDTDLRSLASDYTSLTNSVVNSAVKIVTTDLHIA